MPRVLPAWMVLVLAGCGTGAPQEVAGPSADAGRGRLLYESACQACHTTQAHWRDKSIVRSWGDLVYQVTRWQNNAGQQWSADEVGDVAAYLNRRFYGLACPTPGCLGPSAAAEATPISALAAPGAGAPIRTGIRPPTPTR